MADRAETGTETERARRRDAAPTLEAQEARQGRIVLNTPVRRWVFISGLVGLVILALIVGAVF